MYTDAVSPLPPSFKAIAIAALVWNLIGVVMFFVEAMMTPEQVAALSAAQQQIRAASPAWAMPAFALAVFAGTAGSLGLLLRKRWAVPVLLLSLLGVLVQMGSMYALTPVWALTGLSGAWLPLGLIAVALALWLYARKASTRGWLR